MRTTMRLRRKQRGTVMIESLAVIGMLVIALIALWILYYAFYTKLEIPRFAKFDAWAQGILGCGQHSRWIASRSTTSRPRRGLPSRWPG